MNQAIADDRRLLIGHHERKSAGGGGGMNFSTKASDWKVCITLSIGAAAIVGAAVYFLRFFSPSVDNSASARFIFPGIAIGAGGNISSWALPGVVPDVWTDVPAERDFCVWDLNGADCTLGCWDVGVGASAGQTGFRAFRSETDELFNFWGDLGFSGGFGASLFFVQGKLRVLGTTDDVPSDYYWTA
jgi:hypothetical protein